MAFIGPLDSFNSQPIQTKVGTSQTNIFTATSTKVEKDASGKVVGGTTTLYYSATAGNYTPAATTSDGGKTWTYLKDSDGKEILGADAKRSLETGALKNNTQSQIVSATTKPLGGGLTPEQQKIVAASKENTASTTTNGDSPSGETEKVSLDELQGIKDKAGGVRKNYGNYFYPLDLEKTKQDRIKITMYRYKPKPFNERGIITGDAFGKREIKDPKGSVTLPIQPSITDTNLVDWGSSEMNPLDQAFAGLSLASIAGGTAGAGSAIEGAQEGFPKAAGSLKTAVTTAFAERAASLKGGLLQRLTGGITNPNLELLFNGPQLRSFTFSFVMSARSDREAREIRKIIRFFKQGMSVKRSETNLFLMSPNIFEIKYFYGGGTKEHPWMNKIKECALQNMTVNYTPAGNYATYYDGSMTSYEITLSFGELEPIYDDDYTSLSGGDSDTNKDYQIGY